MDINDLHDVRDGATPRRHRSFNPFIHIQIDNPLMQALFSITRPAKKDKSIVAAQRPSIARKRVYKKDAEILKTDVTLPQKSMVSYKRELRDLGAGGPAGGGTPPGGTPGSDS